MTDIYRRADASQFWVRNDEVTAWLAKNEGATLAELWERCERIDWMFNVVMNASVDPLVILSIANDCVDAMLPAWDDLGGGREPHECVGIVRQWLMEPCSVQCSELINAYTLVDRARMGFFCKSETALERIADVTGEVVVTAYGARVESQSAAAMFGREKIVSVVAMSVVIRSNAYKLFRGICGAAALVENRHGVLAAAIRSRISWELVEYSRALAHQLLEGKDWSDD